jgi:nucleoside permease NupC
LSAIIFFIAFVQMMYYLGVMQWIIRHLYVGLPRPSFFPPV